LPYLILALFVGYAIALTYALFWNGIRWLLRRRVKHDVPAGDDLPPTLVVTLIHGTWARTAAWTRTDSTLCHIVSGAFSSDRVRFVPFTWSGRNSILARHRAAAALAVTLHAGIAKWPRARHVIVGHSHGGSVALLALHHQDLVDTIAGVVTLSTPFLVARPRPLSMVGTLGLSVAPALLVVFGLAQIFNLLQLTPIIDRYPVLQGVFGIGFIALAILIVRRAPKLIASIGSSLAAKMEFPELPSDRLLIIRAPGDEASAALAVAQMLSFLVSRLFDGSSAVLEAAVETVDKWGRALERFGWRLHVMNSIVILTAILAALNAPEAGPARLLSNIATWLASIAVLLWSIRLREGWSKIIGALVLGAVAVPLPILLAVFALPLGPELAAAALLLEVTAEPTPPGRWTVWQFRPGQSAAGSNSGRRLMHSATYEHEDALGEMVVWMRGRLAVPPVS
jgi:pimeloyl-ACP methyl ester carboxylesterase